MSKLFLNQLSSLEKVFLEQLPQSASLQKASMLKGEEFSYQIAYSCDHAFKIDVTMTLDSPISDLITVRRVGNVPSETPLYQNKSDEHYITTKPGLFPDILYDLGDYDLEADQYHHALWISVKTDETTQAGVYPITVTMQNDTYGICENITMELEIINAVMPKQELIFTQWFHTDCIASHYNIEILGEKHWELIEQFIQTAVDNGINMILTPIFTPPLDTKVGKERPTVQLVDIFKEGENYTFGFDKLKKWVDMCKRCGVKYFEMAHLFSQWGAAFSPKIVAYEDGVLKRIFGWDISATSNAYKNFLQQFLPELVDFLNKEGIAKYTYFHISDEPHKEHLENYKAAREIVSDILKDFVIFDALSDYEMYEKGVVTNPVPGTNHIKPFLKNQVPNLWTYNCCAQNIDVGNRFMAMPSYRNRILGLQMYKYQIVGFLHWGYNFYYSQFSRYLVNPFAVTDCGGSYPSGDAFSVYPGQNGPIESLRLKVFHEGIQDMRALKLLEQFMTREEIIQMIDGETEITFSKYPHNPDFILNLREKINQKIKQFLNV